MLKEVNLLSTNFSAKHTPSASLNKINTRRIIYSFKLLMSLEWDKYTTKTKLNKKDMTNANSYTHKNKHIQWYLLILNTLSAKPKMHMISYELFFTHNVEKKNNPDFLVINILIDE